MKGKYEDGPLSAKYRGKLSSLVSPFAYKPEGIEPFKMDARLIPIEGDASEFPEEIQRVHRYMLAHYAETQTPITKQQLYVDLGRYRQMHSGGPWAYFLRYWPCEYLYAASLIYEEPATAEGAE